MDLPPDKIEKLQNLIQDTLSCHDFSKCIDEAITNCYGLEENELESHVVEKLKKDGLIEDIINKFQCKSKSTSCDFAATSAKKCSLDISRQCICLHVYRGKAFLKELDEQSSSSPGSTFKIYLHFRGQRFQSKNVLAACEPNFSESFYFQLNPCEKNCCEAISAESMLSISDPIHIIIVRCNPLGETTLVSSFPFEWRDALSVEKSSSVKALEMMGIGSESKVHAGILEVQVNIVPECLALMPVKVIDAQLHLEKQRKSEHERLFLNYAKQWWKEYIQICDKFKSRPVKIFAEDETGKSHVVCGFVQPFDGCRLVNSPRQAARFVSLFQLEKEPCIGSSAKTDQFQSCHAFLCTKKGDHEDHSNLLCSLFLGFGLDAYVCIGLNNCNNLCSWVVVRYYGDSSVFFWDAKSGRRYSHNPIDPNDPPSLKFTRCMYPFKSVGCAYNHKSFFANLQPIDLVQAVNFCFENSTLWKSLDINSSFPSTGNFHPNICVPFPPLNPPTLNGEQLSEGLEECLKMQISQYRKDIKLSTKWDNKIGSLLGQTLVAYEAEKLYGLPNMENDDFQDAIKRAVPEGDTFKGFPIQFLHSNPYRIFNTCLKNEVFSAIISCRGDGAHHAVRCYVTVFPDDLIATWVMVACRYRSIL